MKVIGFVESVFSKKLEMVREVMNMFGIVFILLLNVIIKRVVKFLINNINKIKV